MATYTPPQVLIRQQFEPVAASAEQSMRPFVAGGHAHLQRFTDPDERPQGALGTYDPSQAQSFAWPGIPGGAALDPAFTKLFVSDAILRYFEDAASAGTAITVDAAGGNSITAAGTTFATGNGVSRSNALADRDVAVGDTAKVTAYPAGGDPVTLWAAVAAVEGVVGASAVGSPTPDAGNAAAQSLDVTAPQTAGTVNDTNLIPNPNGYDGRPTGHLTETYTLTVTQGSVAGDPTGGLIRVRSASGLDDQDDLAPLAVGLETPVGTRGLTVVFDEANAGTGVLVVGQAWAVTVEQAYVLPSVNVDGPYTGPRDTTYIVEAVRGGDADADATADTPLLEVRTTDGTDSQAPFAYDSSGDDFAIGHYGLTVALATDLIAAGDKFYITATAGAAGARRTLRLTQHLPATVPAGTDCDLSLFIPVPELELPRVRPGSPGTTNYQVSDTQVTLAAGAVAEHASWTVNGQPAPLPLDSDVGAGLGQLYAHYRAWHGDEAGTVQSVASIADLDDAVSGPLSPDNPLKWGLYRVLGMSAGVAALYSPVRDPDDLDAWSDAVQAAGTRADAYNLVPLTSRHDVVSLFQAHAQASSSPEQARWRSVWAAIPSVSEVPVVHAGSTVTNHTAATTSDGELAMATVTADTETTGNPLTRLDIASGNVDLLAAGVRSGSLVRINYGVDAVGGEAYETFAVRVVNSNGRLHLQSPVSSAISNAVKIEVWQPLTPGEEAAEIALLGGAYGSTRVRAVYPDTVDAGTPEAGHFLAAALAGQSSGVLPHQGLTNAAVTGFTAVPATSRFTNTQLDTIAGGGVWLVVQDPDSGAIYTRHALTTDGVDDVQKREESVIRNVDAISYLFYNRLKPFLGQANVTDATLRTLRLEITSVVEELRSNLSTTTLGGQLIDATILELRQHLTQKDRVVITLDLVVPSPLNSIELTLVI